MTGRPLSRERLIGGWRLEAWTATGPDGAVRHPLGDDAVGYLLYTAEGCVSFTVTAAGRPRAASESAFAIDPAESRAAMRTCMAWAGRYAVEADTVVHRVEASAFPNWAGREQRRQARLDGDRLTLSAVTDASGTAETHALIWRRALPPG